MRRPAIPAPPRLPAACTTPIAWLEAPCGLHHPTWTDERLEFIGREFTAGTPWEIIDQCVQEMDGPAYEPDDLDELIAARGWSRPPDWCEADAWTDYYNELHRPGNQGNGPFGIPLIALMGVK